MLLQHVLQASSPVYKLKLRGSNLVTVRAKTFGPKAHLGVNQFCKVFAVFAGASFRWKTQSDLLVVFLTHKPMEEISSLKHILKRQRVTCSIVQTKPDASSPRFMLRRQASWLRLSVRLLTLCDPEISFSNVTTRSFCLLKTESTVNVFSSEELRIRFPWIFRSF